MLLLEQQIAIAHRNSHPDWLGIFATWCQATGCVRFMHVQRSRRIQLDQRTMLFECVRGKQGRLRAGFLWSCPRFSITDCDFGGMFLEALSRQDKPELKKCVAFRVTSGEELKPQAVRSQVCLAMSCLLPPAESRRVSSKSWRQIPVTLSLLAGLDPTEVCAMGNWLEKPRRGQNVMPWRYHRAKLKQATLIKHQLRHVMKELLLDQACSSWEHADSECIRLSFQGARKAVAAELAEAVEVEYAWRGSHCMTGEQAFRLRHSSLARLHASSVEQPAASVGQQKRKRPARAVHAGNAAIAPDLSLVKPDGRIAPKPRPKLILDKRPLTQPLASLARAVLAPAQGEEPVVTRERDSEFCSSA